MSPVCCSGPLACSSFLDQVATAKLGCTLAVRFEALRRRTIRRGMALSSSSKRNAPADWLPVGLKRRPRLSSRSCAQGARFRSRSFCRSGTFRQSVGREEEEETYGARIYQVTPLASAAPLPRLSSVQRFADSVPRDRRLHRAGCLLRRLALLLGCGPNGPTNWICFGWPPAISSLT